VRLYRYDGGAWTMSKLWSGAPVLALFRSGQDTLLAVTPEGIRRIRLAPSVSCLADSPPSPAIHRGASTWRRHSCLPRRRIYGHILDRPYRAHRGHISGMLQRMPWKEHGVMKKRYRFVLDWRSGDWEMAQLCRLYAVSRTTATSGGAL